MFPAFAKPTWLWTIPDGPPVCNWEAALGPIFAGIEGLALDIGATGPLAGALVTGLEGAIPGAAIGAAESALSGGKNFGKDVLGGAITGGVSPLLGAGLADVGFGPVAADTIGGGVTGALGSALTGGNVLQGALTGGGQGLVRGVTSARPSAIGQRSTGGGYSSAASAAPSGIGATSPDITSGQVTGVEAPGDPLPGDVPSDPGTGGTVDTTETGITSLPADITGPLVDSGGNIGFASDVGSTGSTVSSTPDTSGLSGGDISSAATFDALSSPQSVADQSYSVFPDSGSSGSVGDSSGGGGVAASSTPQVSSGDFSTVSTGAPTSPDASAILSGGPSADQILSADQSLTDQLNAIQQPSTLDQTVADFGAQAWDPTIGPSLISQLNANENQLDPSGSSLAGGIDISQPAGTGQIPPDVALGTMASASPPADTGTVTLGDIFPVGGVTGYDPGITGVPGPGGDTSFGDPGALPDYNAGIGATANPAVQYRPPVIQDSSGGPTADQFSAATLSLQDQLAAQQSPDQNYPLPGYGAITANDQTPLDAVVPGPGGLNVPLIPGYNPDISGVPGPGGDTSLNEVGALPDYNAGIGANADPAVQYRPPDVVSSDIGLIPPVGGVQGDLAVGGGAMEPYIISGPLGAAGGEQPMAVPSLPVNDGLIPPVGGVQGDLGGGPRVDLGAASTLGGGPDFSRAVSGSATSMETGPLIPGVTAEEQQYLTSGGYQAAPLGVGEQPMTAPDLGLPLPSQGTLPDAGGAGAQVVPGPDGLTLAPNYPLPGYGAMKANDQNPLDAVVPGPQGLTVPLTIPGQGTLPDTGGAGAQVVPGPQGLTLPPAPGPRVDLGTGTAVSGGVDPTQPGQLYPLPGYPPMKANDENPLAAVVPGPQGLTVPLIPGYNPDQVGVAGPGGDSSFPGDSIGSLPSYHDAVNGIPGEQFQPYQEPQVASVLAGPSGGQGGGVSGGAPSAGSVLSGGIPTTAESSIFLNYPAPEAQLAYPLSGGSFGGPQVATTPVAGDGTTLVPNPDGTGYVAFGPPTSLPPGTQPAGSQQVAAATPPNPNDYNAPPTPYAGGGGVDTAGPPIPEGQASGQGGVAPQGDFLSDLRSGHIGGGQLLRDLFSGGKNSDNYNLGPEFNPPPGDTSPDAGSGAVANGGTASGAGGSNGGAGSGVAGKPASNDGSRLTGAARDMYVAYQGNGPAQAAAEAVSPVLLAANEANAAAAAANPASVAGGAASAAPASGGTKVAGNFFSDLFSGNIGHGQLIGDAASALGPGGLFKDVIAGGGLVASLLKGNKPVQGQQQLQTQADQAAAQSKTLQGYLSSGTLPPGMQSGLDQAYNDAAASIVSRYAQTGATGSSAMAQDLQNLRSRMQAQASQTALSLFQQGLNESQISERLYYDLMQAQMTQDANLGSAIGNFTSALAGQGQPVYPGGQQAAA